MRGRRTLALGAVAAVAALLLGASVRPTSASFTAGLAAGGNAFTADTLANYFTAVPGTAVQPGGSTQVAGGNVDALTLGFGTVQAGGPVADVFRVTNVSAVPRTATLALSGPAQIASAVFAVSGTGSVTLAPGASSAVTIAASAVVAGRGSGSLRLQLGGSGWLYRDYPVSIDKAPEAPVSLTGTPRPAGMVSLVWAASTTTTNLAGYDVYRKAGAGAYAKLNGLPLQGTTYDDTATVDGTAYTYVVRATSSGSPSFTSADSPAATATADATPPAAPTAISLGNGGGVGSAYVNLANRSSLSVDVTLPPGSLATDTVTLTLAGGTTTVTRTLPASAGAGTASFTGIDVSTLGDGTVILSATSTDVAGNVSAAKTATATKDSVAPAAPTATYTDSKAPAADTIAGAAETGATVTASRTAPSAAGPYTATAVGGAYTVTVANTAGSGGAKISVTYTVTATDAAGNASTVTTLTFLDAK